MKIDKRDFAPGLDMRTAGTEPILKKEGKTRFLFGYAAVFGTTYGMGNFSEEIASTAFRNTDFSRCACLFNHDSNYILGRLESKTLTLGVDERGLWYRCKLGTSPRALDMLEALERGDVWQSSWSFMLKDEGSDTWTRDKNGVAHRTILDVAQVWDVAPVVHPANPAATVYLLSDRSSEALTKFEGRKEADDERKFLEQTAIMRKDAERLAAAKNSPKGSGDFEADFQWATKIMQNDALIMPRLR